MLLTLISVTNIFCSAKRRAIHALIPWPNGKTRNGFTFSLVSPRIQRSGLNVFGS